MSGTALIALLTALGCGEGLTLKVKKLAATTDPSGQVAIYLEVKDEDGVPVHDLDEKNFRVVEDGKPVPSARARKALLDPSIGGVQYALLLVDLSGPIVDSEDLPELAGAVARFVDRVGKSQAVAVGIFDGRDEITPVLTFDAPAVQPKKVAEAIRKFRPQNRAGNLNGAVYQALHSLENQLDASDAPGSSATLVVFTDRGDLSQTVGINAVKQALHDSSAAVYVIGAGERIQRPLLTKLGRSGAMLSEDPKAFKQQFDELARKLSATSGGRYLFSYCSPKRDGQHKLDLQIKTPKDRGRVSYRFNAEGFGAACSPKHRPTFASRDEGEETAASKPRKKKPAPPSPGGESGSGEEGQPDS